MTTKQLREWLFTNNNEDQWWLSVDGVKEEHLLTLGQIDERLKSSTSGSAKALHASQTTMTNPPWIDVYDAVASPSAQPPAIKAPPSETTGMMALLTPLIGLLLNLLLVRNINLQQGPYSAQNALNVIALIVSVGSAILIGVEATQLGIGSAADARVRKGRRVTGPVGWAVGTMLMWIIFFPAYMFFRSKFGLKNMLVRALAVAILYLGTFTIMKLAISSQITQIEAANETLLNLQRKYFNLK